MQARCPTLLASRAEDIPETSASRRRQHSAIQQNALPAPQQEVVIAKPSDRHAWIPGYWTWRNERYEWMAGHWEVPPSSGAVWVTTRWEPTNDGRFRFFEGYWK